MGTTNYFDNLQAATDYIFKNVKKNIHFATPLGLGKPNQLLNLIYRKVKSDPSYNLKISTALSLEIPHPKTDLEKSFSGSYLEKHFGADYPELDYVLDGKTKSIPPNIVIQEFYMQAAQNLKVESSQRNYTSINYTHVAQSLLDDDLDMIVQLVAAKERDGYVSYSLSCNPDLTLDVVDLYTKAARKLHVVAVVHPDLPFMEGDAEVTADFFSAVVQSSEVKHQLFALPQYPLQTSDFLIGLYASQFLQDDGTIQIGIGSLSDAIVHATLMRHQKNETYVKITSQLNQSRPLHKVKLFNDRFTKGLYGTSEMVTDGFMYLREADILKREIFDLDDKVKRFLHGAFFLGSEKFYDWLRKLSAPDQAGFSMTRVSKVNDLYDNHEQALRRQRQKACFFNTAMAIDVLGGVASDTLPNGQVVSGVGGQYNFVAMSHELPDARSIILLRSTHTTSGKRRSSISSSLPHLTIPRHLRDIVITEYGIADLRGKTDEQVICALIEIADSQFQSGLLKAAKSNQKIRDSYEIPAWARHNTPENREKFLRSFPPELFPPFPFGSDFSATEQKLVLALSLLKEAQSNPGHLLKVFGRGFTAHSETYKAELARLNLSAAKSLKFWIYKILVMGSLKLTENL